MPRPALRSSKLRRRRVHTPGGGYKVSYSKKSVSTSKCASCGTTLAGVPRKRDIGLARLPKTKKRPTRPFGGYYCSYCTRQAVKQKVFNLGNK